MVAAEMEFDDPLAQAERADNIAAPGVGAQ